MCPRSDKTKIKLIHGIVSLEYFLELSFTEATVFTLLIDEQHRCRVRASFARKTDVC